ncbi:hypothetical protein BJ742DRAFT_681400 [Cladochytrium replicatum]|nr:hypothetical protein BJ742DRAFT_681400 [Cladochytrium replicatum]
MAYPHQLRPIYLHQIESVDTSNGSGKNLMDTFGRRHTYLRISLTERCNLRCTYCMPAEGVELSPASNILSASEILRLAKLFVREGVTKVRLTGGEPTVRKDLVDVVAGLNELRPLGLQHIGMTTNGIVLKRKLWDLKRAGMDQLNISLDTLDKLKFPMITRRLGFENVIESIDAATALGFESVKVNVVIIRGLNHDEIVPFVNFSKDRNVYVRFIEYMPFDGNRWNQEKFMGYNEMLEEIKKVHSIVEKCSDSPNDTSKAYRVPGFRGQFGFITSMSEHFCGTCNRLRLMADGNLKVCLFGNGEVNLRECLRQGVSDAELLNIVGAAVKRKKKQHAGIAHRHASPIIGVSKKLHNTNVSSFATGSNYFRYRIPLLSSLARPLPGDAFARGFSSGSDDVSRDYPSQLTHTDPTTGRAHMVDVSAKPPTLRRAVASCTVHLSADAFRSVQTNQLKKGDVLSVARIAGIMAAKNTATLVPLCHPIALDIVDVEFEMDQQQVDSPGEIRITATAVCTGKTGIEMEAIVAVSMAGCTIYDMCKAVDKAIRITDIRLIEKSGGRSGTYKAD